MGQAERDVRDDSDKLLTELEKLKSLESQKRAESFSSPPFHALADQVVDQARTVFDVAVTEERDGDRTVPADRSIEDVDATAMQGEQEHRGGSEDRAAGRD